MDLRAAQSIAVNRHLAAAVSLNGMNYSASHQENGTYMLWVVIATPIEKSRRNWGNPLQITRHKSLFITKGNYSMLPIIYQHLNC